MKKDGNSEIQLDFGLDPQTEIPGFLWLFLTLHFS